MESLNHFLAMGGYADFVWPAYAVAAVVMIGVLVQSLRSLRARESELAAMGEAPLARRKK